RQGQGLGSGQFGGEHPVQGGEGGLLTAGQGLPVHAGVGAVATVQRVGARSAVQVVVPVGSGDGVVAPEPPQVVDACRAGDGVGPGVGPDQALRIGDGVGGAVAVGDGARAQVGGDPRRVGLVGDGVGAVAPVDGVVAGA